MSVAMLQSPLEFILSPAYVKVKVFLRLREKILTWHTLARRRRLVSLTNYFLLFNTFNIVFNFSTLLNFSTTECFNNSTSFKQNFQQSIF
nr:MAG TPA: hypothetical protein [Microviridae sp.]